MSYPKAMLSQLTDLDDSELDEQAGVFNFSKKSAPPSPKVFFNPTSVFLDVPDYRETVSHSKRFTHQPNTSTIPFSGTNNPPLSTTSNSNLENDRKIDELNPQNKVTKLLKSQRTSSRNSERSMSVETFKHKKDSSNSTESKGKKASRSRLPYFDSQVKVEETTASNAADKEALSNNLNSKATQHPGTDSDSNEDSDEQEEYIYKMDPRRDSYASRGHQLSKNRSWIHEGYGKTSRNQTEDKNSEGKMGQRKLKNRQSNFPLQVETRTDFNPNSMNAKDSSDLMYSKALRKSRLKFSSDVREPNPSVPYEHYVYQSHRQTFSQDPNRSNRPPFNRRTYVDWDSEDELLPLWNMSRGMREFRPRRTGLRAISLMPILLILTVVSFGFAIFSLSGLPLVEVAIVAIENILASPKELAFDLVVRGSNLNIWTVSIQKVDLYIYATPIPPPPDNSTSFIYNATMPSTPLSLGKIKYLEQPLNFPGRGFWSSKGSPTTLTSLVLLKDPGLEVLSGNSSQWSQILIGNYDLTVRGDLSYKIFFSTTKVPVCALQRVEPSKAGLLIKSPSAITSCAIDVSS